MFIFSLLFLLAIYLFATKNHGYWKKRNVKHGRPIPLFGNHLHNLLGLKTITEIAQQMYNKYPEEKVVGYFRCSTPQLIIRDPHIAKCILTTDFLYFYCRGLSRNINVQPLSAHILNAEGDTWKLLRKHMTPLFTTAKLKNMFHIIDRCSEKLQVAIESMDNQGGDFDAEDLMARFTCEFVGSYVLGIETKNFKEPSYFQEISKILFTKSLKRIAVTAILELFPKLKKILNVNSKVETILKKTVKNLITERNGKATGRNDYLDYLLKSQETGPIKTNSIEKCNSDGIPVAVEMEMDFKYIIGQIFIFFLAGYETSSSTASCTLYNLAMYPDIQRNIQEEIYQVLMKYNMKLTYEAFSEMAQLEMAVKETMRMFPPAGTLSRVCTKRYTLPGLDVTIDPGVMITIPIQSIQMDEKHFDLPQEFRPERFADNYNQHSFSYLPFGEGPRKCVGERLGYILTMAGLVTILRNYDVLPPTGKTSSTIRRSRISNVVQLIEGGIPLKLKRHEFKN